MGTKGGKGWVGGSGVNIMLVEKRDLGLAGRWGSMDLGNGGGHGVREWWGTWS